MPTLATAEYIINTAAQELGLPPVSLSSAAGDSNGYQMLGMLNALGDELTRVQDWQFLMKDMAYVADGLTDYFDMPADFLRQVNQTEWNTSMRRPMQGPDSPQVWAWNKFGIVAVGVYFRYRINHNKYQIFPLPGAGQSFALYYISKNWVIDGTSPDPQNPRYLDSIIHATDQPMFDRRICIAGLKVKLWAQKGFDTTTLQEEFNYLLASEKAQNQGAPVISLSGSRGRVFLDWQNVPDGTYYGM
jgi:hypothetical protein